MARTFALEKSLCFGAEKQYLLFEEANVLSERTFKVRIYIEFRFGADEGPHFPGRSPRIQQGFKRQLGVYGFERITLNCFGKFFESRAWFRWVTWRPAFYLSLLRASFDCTVFEMNE